MRQKSSKDTETVVINAFHAKTQWFITMTNKINSYREIISFEIIDGKLLEEKFCADF